jgi:hypothetical protein
MPALAIGEKNANNGNLVNGKTEPFQKGSKHGHA